MSKNKKDKKSIERKLLEEFAPSNAMHKARDKKSASFSLINTVKNGRRIRFSKELLGRLGNPEQLQVSLGVSCIAIGEDLPGNGQFFTIKKAHIYSSQLVIEITQTYDLNFTGRTSISFNTVKFKELKNGKTIAIIKIANE